MQKNDWWKILNICLGIFLLGLIVFIIMMVFGMRTAGNSNLPRNENKLEEYYKPKDNKTETNKSVETKTDSASLTNNNLKNQAIEEKKVMDEIDKEEDLSESSEIVTEDKEEVESGDVTTDKDEKVGEIVKLVGKLESADEKKNEFDGNYRLIAEGDTDYTYLWFSGDFKKYVDGLVGEEVVLEVKYNKDGTFEIVSGPTLK